MRISLYRIGVIAPLLLLQAIANAQMPRPLSLAEALSLAQTHSALPKAATARVAGANARISGAKALANPTLTIAQPFGHDTGGLDEAYLLSQTLELGDKRRQRQKAARADFEATKAEAVGTAIDLVFTVQSAYFDALRADSERRLSAESLARAQAFAKAADAQFKAGDAARSAVVRSQIELNRAEQENAASETDSENSYAALKSLLGTVTDEKITLSEPLTYAPAAYALPALLAQARKTRPDLRAARKVREAKEAELHGVRAQSQPDLLLEYRHSAVDPTTGGDSFRIGITLPLFDFGKIRADVNGAKAALKEQEANLQETERAANLEVETAFRNWTQAKNAVNSFRTGRLPRSIELLDMAQIGYEKGANSYLELLDAQHIYRAEQRDYIRALANYNLAKASLQRAVGGDLP